MKTLSVKVPKSLDVALAAEARRRGTSKSALLRDGAETLLRGRRGRGKPSCFDLAADLAGCVDGGPPDLATNKRYMEGFGQ